MVVDNVVIHHCENFQSEIPCILFWIKKREICISESVNSAQSQNFEILSNFSFLPRLEYNEFVNENFHSVGS